MNGRNNEKMMKKMRGWLCVPTSFSWQKQRGSIIAMPMLGQEVLPFGWNSRNKQTIGMITVT